MRRGTLAALALLAMAALAGCADPAGSLRMDPVNDTELAERASHPTDASDLPADLAREMRDRETARNVIENGTLNVTATRPPIEAELPYRYRGEYYDLPYERVGGRAGVATDVEIDFDPTDPEGPTVAFADLPAADRERLESVLASGPRAYRPGSEVGTRVTYAEAAAANSTVLSHAGASMVVVYEGEEYALTVEESEDTTLGVYRYEATLRAESTEAYAEALKSEHAFTPSGLSDEEASVVEEALDGSYYAESTDDEGFAGLVDRFRDREGIRKDEYSGEFLVRYEGRLYWVEMVYGTFVDG
jgi:hypothetical protein